MESANPLVSAVAPLLANDEVDWDAYGRIGSYTDPALKMSKNMLRLVGRMWRAGMVCCIKCIREDSFPG